MISRDHLKCSFFQIRLHNAEMETRSSTLQVSYSARGNPTYRLELWHDGLNKHRLIRGDSDSIVQLKSQIQAAEWDMKWIEVDSRNKQRTERAFGKQQQEEKKTEAIDRTTDAQQELEKLSSLLKATLDVDDKVDWESLKNKAAFPEPEPKIAKPHAEPSVPSLPREPQRGDSKYQPTLGILDKLISSRRVKILEDAAKSFASDLENWSREISAIRHLHAQAVEKYEQGLRDLRATHENEIKTWEAKRQSFLASQTEANASVDMKRTAYEAGQTEAIIDYMDLVLSASKYADYFPQEFDIEYDASAKTAVVDYKLPAPNDLPTLKTIKYVASRDEFEEQFISEAQAIRQYDDVLYQVVLRTVHELFEADVIGALEAVVVNGIVTAIDRTIGKPVTSCILSLRAGRAEFASINLAHVDPKACFKSLKGVGSSKLSGLSPVPPIMPLRREDGRFVSSYEVANTLNGTVNLAAMDWEDFEHLIREVFEKEFSSSGGEVRVTQASRDGGVDAVAFDPDPIRGGKIVIQAKRYTNTVGVGAVRDLYGTVLNEGATKGVLVTTSDYGPDSYAFANGKPLVLLSGANLLHMLEKHGHPARIDIQEAKKLVTKSLTQ
jgi:restriction system protein